MTKRNAAIGILSVFGVAAVAVMVAYPMVGFYIMSVSGLLLVALAFVWALDELDL